MLCVWEKWERSVCEEGGKSRVQKLDRALSAPGTVNKPLCSLTHKNCINSRIYNNITIIDLLTTALAQNTTVSPHTFTQNVFFMLKVQRKGIGEFPWN